jgi:2'-5' RNA ligase
MKYAIIHRPETDTSQIETISKKYDPNFGLVGPHATLVFPFPSEQIDEANLIVNLNTVASVTKKFKVLFTDTELSWDQWLFLTPTIGRSEIELLHDKLYELDGIRPHLRADIPFVPHITLGLFAKQNSNYGLRIATSVPLDKERYEQARREIDSLAVKYEYIATRFELLSVADDYKSSKVVAVFELSE